MNEIAAGMADADDETVANSDIQRPQLKIKQSLTREFSIENLKRAADKTQLKHKEQLHLRTPSGRNLSLDPSTM